MFEHSSDDLNFKQNCWIRIFFMKNVINIIFKSDMDLSWTEIKVRD